MPTGRAHHLVKWEWNRQWSRTVGKRREAEHNWGTVAPCAEGSNDEALTEEHGRARGEQVRSPDRAHGEAATHSTRCRVLRWRATRGQKHNFYAAPQEHLGSGLSFRTHQLRDILNSCRTTAFHCVCHSGSGKVLSTCSSFKGILENSSLKTNKECLHCGSGEGRFRSQHSPLSTVILEKSKSDSLLLIISSDELCPDASSRPLPGTAEKAAWHRSQHVGPGVWPQVRRPAPPLAVRT